MSQPPQHLKPDFDPYKLKVAELRGILLQHDIPFPSNAKKTDLVKLFDSKLKPQAATLLQQYTSIRPSTQGILDGESQDGSLKELDTDSEQERQFEEEQKEKARVKKKGSRKSLVGGKGKGRRSVAGGKGKEKEVDGDGVGEGEEEREKDRKARKARRQSLKELLAQAEGKQSGREEEEDELAISSQASGLDQEEEEEEEEEEGEIGVSPKKRKAPDGPGTPRLSVLSRTSAGSTLNSPATEAGNFSDYNPFQSRGEETPGRENKRRKSSLLPSSRLSSRKSLSSLTSTTSATSSSSSLTPHPAKERRSMPTSASTSSLSIAGTAAGGRAPYHTSQKKARVPPPVPVVPAAYSSAGSAVGAGSGSGGTSSTRTMSTSSFFAPPTPPLAASLTSTASSALSAGFFAPAPAREAAGSRASGWGTGSGSGSGSGSGIGRKRSRLEEVEVEVEEGEVDEGGEVEEEEEQEEEGEGEDEGMQLDDDDDEGGGGRAGEEESAAHQEEEDFSMDQDQDDLEPAPTQAHVIPSPPFRPSSRTSSTASASAGGGGRATPVAVGKKYMVPVSQHKTTPPEVARLLAEHRASGGSSGGGEVGSPARQGGSGAQLVGTPAKEREWEKEKEYRQVTVRTEERKGRRSDPSGSPSLSKLLGSAPAAQEGPTPRRSLPATLPRPPAARAAPAPPLPASPAALVPNKSTQKKKKRLSQTASAITLSPPPFSSTSTSSYTDPFLPSGLSSLLTPLFLSLLLSYILWARAEKLSLGFCDTNSPSNRNLALREFDGQTSLAAPFLPNLPPSILAVLDATGLRPACTICPSHGACSRGVFEGCELDYVPRSSFLSSISFGLIPTSPTCEADTEKQVAVAKAAAAAGRVLRKRRGEVVCGSWKVERQRRREARDKFGLQGEEEESFVFGVEAEKVLAALVREDEASPAPFPPEILEEINRLALRDLEMHGEVVKWVNDSTHWYASLDADLSLSCRLRLALYRSAKKHKLSLSSVVFLIGMVAWGRRKWRKRGEEKELVRGLVERAVRQLQQQERSHHLHPTLTPYAHLAPSHLRDLLLPPTSLPSLTTRTRLWNQVSKLIEGNSNVRVGEVEVGGEVMRGWRWTGPTGVGSGLEIEGGKVKEEQEEEEGGSGVREMVQVGGGKGGVASPFGTPVSLK